MSESKWMGEARQIAAQCWCGETTSHLEMIPELAEVIAVKIANWMDTGAFHAGNEEYWRGEADRLQAENATLKADCVAMAEKLIWAHDAAILRLDKEKHCPCDTCQTARKYA